MNRIALAELGKSFFKSNGQNNMNFKFFTTFDGCYPLDSEIGTGSKNFLGKILELFCNDLLVRSGCFCRAGGASL